MDVVDRPPIIPTTDGAGIFTAGQVLHDADGLVELGLADARSSTSPTRAATMTRGHVARPYA